MALVSEKTMQRLTDKRGFVYKNFEYIFRNPLWNADKVPEGFWICPYYWMSLLIGFLFMRLFFVPTMLGLGKVIQIFPFLNGIYNKFFAMGLRKCGVEEEQVVKLERAPLTGVGFTLLAIAIPAFIGSLGYSLYLVLRSFIPAFMTGVGAHEWGWIAGIHAFILIAAAIACAVVNERISSKSKCRPWVYFKLIAVLVFFHELHFVWPYLIEWEGLFRNWFVESAWPAIMSFFTETIPSLFMTTMRGIWFCITYTLFLGIQVWMAFLGFWVAMYALGVWGPKVTEKILDARARSRDESEKRDIKKTLTAFKDRPATKKDWCRAIMRYIKLRYMGENHDIENAAHVAVKRFYWEKDDMKSPYLDSHKNLVEDELILHMLDAWMDIPEEILRDSGVLTLFNKELSRQAYRPKRDPVLYISKIFDAVEAMECILDKDPDPPKKDDCTDRGLNEESVGHKMNLALREATLKVLVGCELRQGLVDMEEKDKEAAKKVVDKFISQKHKESADMLKMMAKQHLDEKKRKEEKKKKREQVCEVTTERLQKFLYIVFVLPWKKIASAIKAVWRAAWTFMKMRKQEACPYVEFHDGEAE